MHQRSLLLANLRLLFTVILSDALQQVLKARQAMPRLGWEIRTAKKRLLGVVGKKYGQWPAAGVLGQDLLGQLVDFVQIGALFTVDFNVDEQLVHKRRCSVVLEGLMRHHMTPVTGCVANRQQNRLAGVPCQL